MTKPPTPVALSNSLTDLEEPFTDFDFNGSDLRWLRCKIRHIAKMPVAAKYYLRAGEIVELEALAACPWDDLIEGIKRLEPYGWSSKNPATHAAARGRSCGVRVAWRCGPRGIDGRTRCQARPAFELKGKQNNRPQTTHKGDTKMMPEKKDALTTFKSAMEDIATELENRMRLFGVVADESDERNRPVFADAVRTAPEIIAEYRSLAFKAGALLTHDDCSDEEWFALRDKAARLAAKSEKIAAAMLAEQERK